MKKKNVILVSFFIILFFTACEKEGVQENFQEEKDALEQLDPATRALIDQLLMQPWPAYITNRYFDPLDRIIRGEAETIMTVTIYGYESPWELEVYDILNDSIYLRSSQIPQISHSGGSTTFTFNPLYPTDGTKVAIYELRVKRKDEPDDPFAHLDVFIQFPIDMDFEIDGLRDTYFYHLPGEKTDLSLKYKQAVLKEPTDYIQLRVIDDSENVISNFSNGQQTYQLKFLSQSGTIPFYLSENDSEENRKVHFQHKIHIEGQMDTEWETYETAIQIKKSIELDDWFLIGSFNPAEEDLCILISSKSESVDIRLTGFCFNTNQTFKHQKTIINGTLPGELPEGANGNYTGYCVIQKEASGVNGWPADYLDNIWRLSKDYVRWSLEYYNGSKWVKIEERSQAVFYFGMKNTHIGKIPAEGGYWPIAYTGNWVDGTVKIMAYDMTHMEDASDVYTLKQQIVSLKFNDFYIYPNPYEVPRMITIKFTLDGTNWYRWDETYQNMTHQWYDRYFITQQSKD